MNTKVADRSRYDELHDKYHTILTTKAGTRYERLAAMVFKALEDNNVVIHDFELSGADPDVKHQIDVTIEVAGTLKRVLVECKDFDISGSKVGLDIIRNFRSVIEDTQADDGYVFTCNGFTSDAQKYAASKGIKLCVLRLFEDRDMDGRIAKILLGITVQQPKDPKVSVFVGEASHPRYVREMTSIGVTTSARNDAPVYFVKDKGRRQFNEFLTAKMNDAMQPGGPKAIRITLPPDGWQIQVDRNPPIPFEGIIIDFDVDEAAYQLEVASARIAEMILSGMGTKDMIIFGDQIERYSIDQTTGEVVEPSSTP